MKCRRCGAVVEPVGLYLGQDRPDLYRSSDGFISCDPETVGGYRVHEPGA